MPPFTVYPAIDLRHGELVRLQKGDPGRQTLYSTNPISIAEAWLKAGATWLHVVNLDGAFGESDLANQHTLKAIMDVAGRYKAHVQFGGGLRALSIIENSLEAGVNRIVLGTLAIEHPEILPELIKKYGPDRIAASLDMRDGMVRVRGWQSLTSVTTQEAALEFRQAGLRWLVFTDIARDGLQTGLNIPATVAISRATGLDIIASGGVAGWDDIHAAHQAGLAGVIVGKALYEGIFNPHELFGYPDLNDPEPE
jgi:phosphoribosylformimino-5-aminoimidazole carboxamide ribotide isomerase